MVWVTIFLYIFVGIKSKLNLMKKILFDSDARDKLLEGISLMSKAVKSTLGPSGGTTLIESGSHTGGLTVTKDGVTVAKSIIFEDRVMNLAARIMREAAERTASIAGDGTTTSIVLAEAISVLGSEYSEGCNVTEFLRLLDSAIEHILDKLSFMSVDVTTELLYHVAKISSNNDEYIGNIIGRVYEEVGKNGIVTVERSQNERTHYEVTNGVKVDRGWSSPMFINDHKRDECIMEDVKVLVCDGEIGNILDIEKVLKPIINNRERLLIIAPCSLNVVNTLAANVMKNGLKVCNISPPSFGYRQHELMQDIALSVGATYFSEKTGDDLRLIEYSDLGDASKVIVGKGETIIVKSSGVTEEVEARIGQLWEQHKLLEHDSEREFVLSRIASLSGGIGVIYVGGNTDLEQKELYDRVDDAVCAVRAALSDGILPGGGVALYDISTEYGKAKGSPEKVAVDAVLRDALKLPLLTMYNNSEVEFAAPKGGGQGMDLKSGKQGNMIDMGIVDPTLVTKSALRNAASVAITFMSTKTIIHNTSDTMNPIISAKKI
jgi:chaperonin GroEL